ncbi:hypothetical protein Tco_0018325, partial [Tanacetum coccineum]
MVKEGLDIKSLSQELRLIELRLTFPHPTTVKGVRSFLGHAGWCYGDDDGSGVGNDDEAVAVSGVPVDRSHVHTHDHDGSEAPDE